MSFNTDPNKQTQELILSRKINREDHPPLVFNNNNLSEANSQKHLGIALGNSLSFAEHLKVMLSKVNEITVGLLRKLHNILPRSPRFTIYKAFVRPHLDYGDIVYDQAFKAPFHQKLELIEYNACLAITGLIRGTSKKKLYEELGLKSYQHHRMYLIFINSTKMKSHTIFSN